MQPAGISNINVVFCILSAPISILRIYILRYLRGNMPVSAFTFPPYMIGTQLAEDDTISGVITGPKFVEGTTELILK